MNGVMSGTLFCPGPPAPASLPHLFSTRLPAPHLQALEKLQFLYLADNLLDSIPGPLPLSLRSLHLQVSGLPKSMAQSTEGSSQIHGTPLGSCGVFSTETLLETRMSQSCPQPQFDFLPFLLFKTAPSPFTSLSHHT